MRSPFAIILLLLGLAATALAWSNEDYEIFDIVSALEAAEGKGSDFYNHIGVDPSATSGEINKAYRKKSLELHPDKNPGVKDIQERFARLGVIAQILRSPEKRERYNFFHKNGVPRWRGTGYYYSRYRPTLSHTLVFLVILTSAFHYLVLRMNYTKHQNRIEYFVNAARSAAGVLGGASDNQGGKVAVPVQGRRRKVRVPMVEGNDSAGTLELIVNGNEVLLPHDDGTLEPISGLATPPSIAQTWFFSLLTKGTHKAISVLPPSAQSSIPAFLKPHQTAGLDLIVDEDDDDDESALDTPTPAVRVKGKLNAHASARSKKTRSNANTPKDSPATTELESEGEGDASGTGEIKKKKAAVGKAGGARRRKMALKK
ncbi:endoplasmic reticulum protein [Kwoniella heveanensis CBS 569]|nr:endoplasmic reticulum protein [Kwoniella heveanensis CBS 569]